MRAITIAPRGRGRLDAAYEQAQEYPFARINQAACGLVGVSEPDTELLFGNGDGVYTALFPDLAAALSAVVDLGAALWCVFDPTPRPAQ